MKISMAAAATLLALPSLLVLVTKDHPAQLSTPNNGGGSFSNRELSPTPLIADSGDILIGASGNVRS